MTKSRAQQIREIIAEQLALPADFDTSKTFEELGGDSLDLIEVIMTVEDVFDREIDESQFVNEERATIDHFIKTLEVPA